MKNFKEKYGQYALITGASSGIGKEFALQLAEKGLDLVLVARRKNLLDILAKQIKEEYGVKVKNIALDLTETGAVEKLEKETANLEIGLVVPNAGIEFHGNFLNGEIADETRMLTLNTVVPMQIAHTFGKHLAKRNRGGILFVSSMFAMQSVPFFANYAATKAYILSLGQALNVEMKKNGVDVTVLAPGLTKTELSEKMEGMDFSKMPITEMTAKSVAKKGIDTLGKKSLAIPGARNVFMDIIGKYTTPRSILASMFGFLVSRAMDKDRTEFAH